MKKYILLFTLTLTLFSVTAQKPRKNLLKFLPVDSVMIMPYYSDNRLRNILMEDSTLQMPTSYTTKTLRKTFGKRQKQWTLRADSLNRVGGTGDENDGWRQIREAQRTINMAAPLFLSTAHADYMNAIEAAMCNSIQAGISGVFPKETNREAAHTLFSCISYYYAVDNEGVYVNLFDNSNAVVTTPLFSFVIDQITSLPWLNRVKLRISYRSGNHQFKVRIRIPQWSGKPTLYVNGKEYVYVPEDGYAVISRNWNSGDEIFWDFDLTPQFLPATHQSMAMLRRGPVVYAAAAPQPAGTLVNTSNLTPDYNSNFVRLYGKLSPASANARPFLFLPYSESFGFNGKTNVWVKIGE